MVGLEPTKPNGNRFTVCSRCRWRTPQYIFCGTSESRTPLAGSSVRCIHHVCQSSKVAERAGFEPAVHFCTTGFKTVVLSHSTTSPKIGSLYIAHLLHCNTSFALIINFPNIRILSTDLNVHRQNLMQYIYRTH